jgi:hypothetical protein
LFKTLDFVARELSQKRTPTPLADQPVDTSNNFNRKYDVGSPC